MHKLVRIAGLVAGLCYAGAATQYGAVLGAVSTPQPTLNGLADALRATGASLEQVTITGWFELPDPSVERRVTTALEATPTRPGEKRQLRTVVRGGSRSLSVDWSLAGAATGDWATWCADVRRTLSLVGSGQMITVQLEGTTVQSVDMFRMVQSALDAVGATQRQPWAGSRAASIAAHTGRLPAGPYPTNIQAAARRDSNTGRTRVWVAWPALQQEY